MALARISITLPRDVLTAADRRARALDRSRSWLIVEALRTYLATPAGSASAGVRESDTPVYAVREVADARRQHLAADLKRSPAERLQRAEQLTRLARQVRPRRGRRQQVIGFASYEDFYEWKKARLAGG
ncbi:MAG TPA: ribbon-helix-helix protein, CopG family [Gemmatimonadales bacterium]|nr:ribbon-helix-helix protein, CopG family [Gemmatimonadales bacterium]